MQPTGAEVRAITCKASSKIEAIKELRSATGLGLAQAKPLVEQWWEKPPSAVEVALRAAYPQVDAPTRTAIRQALSEIGVGD